MDPRLIETPELFRQLDLYAAMLPVSTIVALKLMAELGIKPTTFEPAVVGIYRSYAAIDAELRSRGVLK
jgi:hypothetical protein